MRMTTLADPNPPMVMLARHGYPEDPVLKRASFDGTTLPREAFFLIHGYNTDADRAESNYLQMEYRLEKAVRRPLPATPLRVMWPGYQGDNVAPSLYFARSAELAVRSGGVFATFLLERLGELGPSPHVVLVAHSLGCLLALTTARLLLSHDGPRPAVTLVLMAAAVPVTADFSSIRQARRRAVLYSPADGILKGAFRIGQFLVDRTWAEAVGLNGRPVSTWDPAPEHLRGHGHSDYWSSDSAAEAVCRLLGLATQRSTPDGGVVAWAPPPEHRTPERGVAGRS